jgi:hypothetical protein
MSARYSHKLPTDMCFRCFKPIGPKRPVGVQSAKDDDIIIICRRCTTDMCHRSYLQQLLNDAVDFGYIVGYHASHRDANKRRASRKRAVDTRASKRRADIKVLTTVPSTPDGDKSQT